MIIRFAVEAMSKTYVANRLISPPPHDIHPVQMFAFGPRTYKEVVFKKIYIRMVQFVLQITYHKYVI